MAYTPADDLEGEPQRAERLVPCGKALLKPIHNSPATVGQGNGYRSAFMALSGSDANLVGGNRVYP